MKKCKLAPISGAKLDISTNQIKFFEPNFLSKQRMQKKSVCLDECIFAKVLEKSRPLSVHHSPIF